MGMHNYNSVLFLTLRVFSATGGIEKVSRIVGKALYRLGLESGNKARIYSMYDKKEEVDEKYFPKQIFYGFATNKLKFVSESIRQGRKSDVVILSHINLLSVGYLIKLFSPETKLILITHGIEVWKPMTGLRKRMLAKCDLILPVSKYTKDVMVALNNLPENKLHVLNNCLDPFLPEPVRGEKSSVLLARYGLKKEDTILMTLTRLSIKEKYKGYDNVLQSVKVLATQYPSLKYLIVGKYDAAEKKRLDALIEELEIQKFVVFAGFVPDEELAEHFNLADVYVMPSKKEGFGIVFIEAMYYGKPVIAGNKDGSVDALNGGEFGLLVNPDDQEEITAAIKNVVSNTNKYIPDHTLFMNKFSYPVYKEKIKGLLLDISKNN
ncbi:glycosyltransferase family 4 protein [Ferruginibacter lapsinanis]|uniref:glycosyltransferase family 4 protein n=1 Tax=Ferruginibacter lapsinanis TaxID=563172 RepID=UPI001E6101BE|nr:glycosyltransferase family 4 protein [Ferruginibacter lapsinanis]UEG49477.1 glycosyltransferase family 4 protein [Ferruginibacter lapsinanis]